MDGEKDYQTQREVTFTFTNQTEEPIFENNSWNFSMKEKDSTLSEKLPEKAIYKNGDSDISNDSDQEIFYYIASSVPDRLKSIFKIDELSGNLSLNEALDYEIDETINFFIVASNSRTKDKSSNPKSYLNVTVTVSIQPVLIKP